MNWKFTHIHHPVRIAMGLTLNEYCLIDLIFLIQNDPIDSIDGCCDLSIKTIGNALGFSAGMVSTTIKNLEKRGFVRTFTQERKQVRKDWGKIVSGAKPYSNSSNDHFDPLPERTTFVYLMLDSNTSLVKIGQSIDPAFREKTLQSEKPNIDLIFKSSLCSPKTERFLHDKFKDKRIRGEWFSLNESDILEATNYLELQTKL